MNKTTPEELLERAYSLSSAEDTQALYDDWAETYDQTMLGGLKYVTPRKTASLLAETNLDSAAAILDVGSGTGLAGDCLASLGYRNIDALDYSKAMLAVARNRRISGRPVYSKTIEADLLQPLPLRSQSYDAMICTGTFTHSHVGATCLEELFRVLKPEGLFACTVHKDIWGPEGFADEIRRLAGEGIVRTRGMVMDIYFETDAEPQGWYLLWEKLG